MTHRPVAICALLALAVGFPTEIIEENEVELKARGDADYYARINPNSSSLKADLHRLISNHKAISYSGVWNAFEVIDQDLQCDQGNFRGHGAVIGDVYSSFCWDAGSQRCGSFHKEGDCFNREHGWPKSWFGGFERGHNAQTDLFLLWPSDGYVNAKRGNLPLGNVDKHSATYKSTAGAMVGPCITEGYEGEPCFEVPDEYKGDFARSYFYISVRYMDVFDCCDEAGVDGSHIKPWMEAQLREWHKQDPPSDTEKHIVDMIYSKFQHNRSPFVDHPEWVDLIQDF